MKSVHWSSVVNLANSIIGVGILATPLCMKNLGLALGPLTLLLAGYLAYETSQLLIHASTATRSGSYEQLSMRAFGKKGKKLCELNICLMLFGVLVAFHSVIGDSSTMLAALFGIPDTPKWRFIVQLILLVVIELPFSLLRNISSLNMLSVVSLVIYTSFTTFLFCTGWGDYLMSTKPLGIDMFNLGGLLKAFPILVLAFNCQTTLLPIYNELPGQSAKKMQGVIKYAIGFVGFLYMNVGMSGVLAFGEKVEGNVLNNFSMTSLIVLFKIGFLLCIAFSYPLVVYPTRISINSLCIGDKGDPTHMSNNMFNLVTAGLIGVSLAFSVMFPRVEFILGISGATSGCFIGMIFPALIYLKITDAGKTGRGFAKIILFIGVTTSLVGLISLFGPTSEVSSRINPKHELNTDYMRQKIKLNKNLLHEDPEKLGHTEIVSMLAKLQKELDETKKELRAEKALRIEKQIMELKEQLQNPPQPIQQAQQPLAQQPVGQQIVAQQPVAQQPVAQQPVAQQPVVQQPVAQQPVVQKPIAQQPVVPKPGAQQPAAQQPAAQQPVVQQPVVQQPVAQQPVAQKIQQPVVQQPVAQQPVAQQPVAQQPVVQKPAAQKPVAQKSVSQRPVAQKPAVQQPVAQQRVVQQPVAQQPVVNQPVAQNPVAQNPVDQKPVAQKTVAQKSVVQQSVVQKPVVQQPVAQKPVVEKPLVQQPVAQQSVIQQPVVQQPVAQQPVVQQPVVQQPVVQQPVVQQPVVQQPVVQQPVVQQPVVQQPVVQQPVAQPHVAKQLDTQKPLVDKSAVVEPQLSAEEQDKLIEAQKKKLKELEEERDKLKAKEVEDKESKDKLKHRNILNADTDKKRFTDKKNSKNKTPKS